MSATYSPVNYFEMLKREHSFEWNSLISIKETEEQRGKLAFHLIKLMFEILELWWDWIWFMVVCYSQVSETQDNCCRKIFKWNILPCTHPSSIGLMGNAYGEDCLRQSLWHRCIKKLIGVQVISMELSTAAQKLCNRISVPTAPTTVRTEPDWSYASF